jgi:translation initiation factor 3 subunit D
MVARLTQLPLMKMRQIPCKTPLRPIREILTKKPPSINSATSLSLEATYINQNFGFPSVIKTPPPPTVNFAKPNPFYGLDETEPLASCGNRYRVFDLGISEDENIKICVQTEVDAYSPCQGNLLQG